MKKRRSMLLLIPISILFLLAAKNSSFLAEYVFARVIFRIFAIPIGFVSRWFPVSIAEILLFGILLLILGVFGRIVFLLCRKRRMLIPFLKQTGWQMLQIAAVLFFLFTVLCGTNYYRYEFETWCTYKTKESSVQELYELCIFLAEKANENKAQITNIDKEGAVRIENFWEIADTAEKAFDKLAEEFPVFHYSTGRAKPILASRAMSYTGIVGIYSPFTVEANVNQDVADYNRPADMCHELAHLHGFMRENEANFISYLACISSEDAVFRYSGYMMALIYATNALYDESVEKYTEIAALLSEEVKVDLRVEDAYWDELREKESYQVVEAVSDKVNDTYLKVNGQSDGVKSYGMMVDLLLAKFCADKEDGVS